MGRANRGYSSALINAPRGARNSFATLPSPPPLSLSLSLLLDRPTRIRDETHLRFYASFEGTSQQPFPQDTLDDAATIPTLRRRRRRHDTTTMERHENHKPRDSPCGERSIWYLNKRTRRAPAQSSLGEPYGSISRTNVFF